ncbi:hypothetical protein KR038_006639 [Drosophila bunnanda]|nr:hypothetical protein KR038_006639 [Drosophila bunnanda]
MNRSEVNFEDDYEHPEGIEYILESELMSSDGSMEFQRLEEEYNSMLLNPCHCKGSCDSKETCSHGGQYKYSPDGKELLLWNSDDSPKPVIECNPLCECSKNSCFNRLVQRGPRRNLEVFDSPIYGSKGLRSKENIPCGAFISEYAGELLTITEAKRRLETNEALGLMNYVLVLNEYSSDEKQQVTIVDPSRRGNIGRYLNHSCEPNCHIAAVRIECPIPKIGIFAARDIKAQEELCFHYGGEGQYKKTKNGKTCLCAAPKCTGYMPSTAID